MKFSLALLGSQILLATAIVASPIAEVASGSALSDTAFTPTLDIRESSGSLYARDDLPSEDAGPISCEKFKRSAEAAAIAASDAYHTYIRSRSLISRDELTEDAGPISCEKLKRSAKAAASEAASAYERYAQSLKD